MNLNKIFLNKIFLNKIFSRKIIWSASALVTIILAFIALWTLFGIASRLSEAYSDRRHQQRILSAYENKQFQNGALDPDLTAAYDELTNIIVYEESVADVLTHIAQTAETHRVSALNFETGAIKPELSNLPGLLRWSVDFRGEGGYTDIIEFLNTIDDDEIHYLLDGWSIRENAPNENLSLQLDLSFYSFQDQFPSVVSPGAQNDEKS